MTSLDTSQALASLRRAAQSTAQEAGQLRCAPARQQSWECRGWATPCPRARAGAAGHFTGILRKGLCDKPGAAGIIATGRDKMLKGSTRCSPGQDSTAPTGTAARTDTAPGSRAAARGSTAARACARLRLSPAQLLTVGGLNIRAWCNYSVWSSAAAGPCAPALTPVTGARVNGL